MSWHSSRPVVGVADWIRTSMFSFCRRDPIHSRHCDSVWGVVPDSNRCFPASQAGALAAMLTTPSYTNIRDVSVHVWHAIKESNPVGKVLEAHPIPYLHGILFGGRHSNRKRCSSNTICLAGSPRTLSGLSSIVWMPDLDSNQK